ncbi:branched-chain amino acid ABC transporter permease [Pusillimonas sp.]|uniref:branched-chain amino acid ABC transporter permease n=1 Tax=Pusillimonas sp. TaxID=3040095 RepID=UPI0037C69102
MEKTQITSTDAANLANATQRLLDVVIVLVLTLTAAVLLWMFLLAESWVTVLGLLALFAIALVWVQRHPHFEQRLIAAFRRQRGLAVMTGVIVALVFPWLLRGDTYAMHLLIIGNIYAVLALALNFQLGSANIPNFATGASYGIGAYASALLAIHFGVSFWLGLLVAAAVATTFGYLLGLPSMRTRDSYQALVTIAFGIVVHQLLMNLEWTGGANGLVGIPAPTLFGHSFNNPIELFGHSLPSQGNFYYVSVALVGIAILSAKRLHNSRIGLAWNALRDDEIAARACGINVTWYKVQAFAVDAFLAGFAGTLYAFYVSFISPDNFTFLVSVTIMTMVIAGGMDNTLGVIVGALLLTMLPEKLRAFSDYRILFYGVVVILFLIIRPRGIFPQQVRNHEHS